MMFGAGNLIAGKFSPKFKLQLERTSNFYVLKLIQLSEFNSKFLFCQDLKNLKYTKEALQKDSSTSRMFQNQKNTTLKNPFKISDKRAQGVQ
ncbi:hypothetical protein PGT21_029796 [Puccinia graminis f. sp. tritici]|uniref:Uncharacterized protein n=1 Tax=Puccinia graminis f. sp. tritici TaxID=56615 RepID=A0A5B0Q509_PUCGR|nr:hypothetical protein PGT21_029796 [Puccinia graminis f. sp. tritici]KAA1108024.1 hypothetical protein PGTUg99_024604 [Puccinia graminis f. sp. tritici]